MKQFCARICWIPLVFIFILEVPIQFVYAATAPPSTSDGGLRDKDAALTSKMNLVAKYGTVVDHRDVGVAGMTAFTVEKNGHRVVLYATSGGEALIAGSIWEASTGRNISDQFSPTSNRNSAAQLHPREALSMLSTLAALDGVYNGQIPESMRTVDELAGVKEGSGTIAETVYIIFDPRCPVCSKAYSLTRNYIKKGFSIKWIPAVALGDTVSGEPLAATVLQSKDSSILNRILENHEPIGTPATSSTRAALQRNLDFLFAAFKQNGGVPGVPVAFFIDRRSGTPRMTTGIGEPVVLQDIFGKP